MKKLLSFALTLALALSMGTTAFAATAIVGTNGDTQDIDVKAKYVDSVSSPTVCHVDVAWGAMEFTYTVSGTKTWKADTHQYALNTSDAWTANGNEITVTNHSNTGIKADFVYANKEGFGTVTSSFSNASLTLPTAEDKPVGDAALSGKTALTLGGTLASDRTVLTNIGTVTVAISHS